MSPAFAASEASPPPPRWEPMPQSAKTKITKTAMTAQRIHCRCLKFSRSALSIFSPKWDASGALARHGVRRIEDDTPEANGGKVRTERLHPGGHAGGPA